MIHRWIYLILTLFIFLGFQATAQVRCESIMVRERLLTATDLRYALSHFRNDLNHFPNVPKVLTVTKTFADFLIDYFDGNGLSAEPILLPKVLFPPLPERWGVRLTGGFGRHGYARTVGSILSKYDVEIHFDVYGARLQRAHGMLTRGSPSILLLGDAALAEMDSLPMILLHEMNHANKHRRLSVGRKVLFPATIQVTSEALRDGVRLPIAWGHQTSFSFEEIETYFKESRQLRTYFRKNEKSADFQRYEGGLARQVLRELNQLIGKFKDLASAGKSFALSGLQALWSATAEQDITFARDRLNNQVVATVRLRAPVGKPYAHSFILKIWLVKATDEADFQTNRFFLERQLEQILENIEAIKL